MSTEKQLGNECFKTRDYTKAVTHYNRYLEDEHQDNKNAYFNLSLCYSKLNKSGRSIEAAEKAKSIDHSYGKCYYHLANQYRNLQGKEYEVFINAVRFIKLANEDQDGEKNSMRELAANYRKRWVMKKGNVGIMTEKEQRKAEELDKIIEVTETLVEAREERVEVDKFIEEWVEEWGEGTQDEEAKWLEIEYITEEIDYDYGINLAYFYANQIRNTEIKKVVVNNIVELKARLRKENEVDYLEVGIDPKEVAPVEVEEDSESDENLFVEKKVEEVKTKAVVKGETGKTGTSGTNGKTVQKEEKKTVEKKVESSSPKKKLNMLEKLQQKKELMDEMNQESINQKPRSNRKQKTEQHEKKEPQKLKSAAVEKPEVKPEFNAEVKTEVKGDVKPVEKTPAKDNSEAEMEALYQKHCGELSKAKDIFTGTLQCVIKILQAKRLSTVEKGALLVQLRKRAKKFKMIMGSTSENEQTVVYDLLCKNNMEEYAVDLAPKHHKI